MNILALGTDGFGAGGGIAHYNLHFLEALGAADRVRNVTVLPRYGDLNAIMPRKVLQVTPRPGRNAWSFHAARLAARGRFDAIFCGHMNAAPLAFVLSRASSRPLWLQAHGIEAWEPRGGLAKRALDAADLVTVVSRYTRQRLLAWSDINPARVRVLPNTYDLPSPITHAPDDHLRQLGLEGRRVILTVGRLASGERYKGHDRIIAAMPEVARRVADAAYLVVGSGDDLARLTTLAAEKGVADRVVFAGQVTDKDLSACFASAKIFAMPSTGEGFGIVFLEAVAAGLPVIAGNRDGSADALADGALGRLVDPDDSASLADALVDGLEGRIGCDPDSVERFSFAHFSRKVNDLVQHIS
jgi:phosphatidylinositol alpha-1,6-mannosyltransferase